MTGARRRGDHALPVRKASAKACNDLTQQMNFADADAMKPDDRPAAVGREAWVRGVAEPFCFQSANRLLVYPRLPAKPGREHHCGREVDEIEKIRHGAGILSP